MTIYRKEIALLSTNAVLLLALSACGTKANRGLGVPFDIPRPSLTDLPTEPAPQPTSTQAAPSGDPAPAAAPGIPSIDNPAARPFLSNAGTLAISGACTTGMTVALGGDVVASDVSMPAGALTQACESSTYAFALSKTADSFYGLTVRQINASGISSASESFTWILDTLPPSAPSIASPLSSPHISSDNATALSGRCESGATVTLSGAENATTDCADSTYAFALGQVSDGTYNYSIRQTDPTGNASVAVPFLWIRDASIPSTPVIAAPAENPYYSSGTLLTVSGSCTTGHLVTLSGVPAGDVTVPAGNLTQTCVSVAFSFIVAKTADDTYPLTIKQTSPSHVDSALASRTWIRDTAAPIEERPSRKTNCRGNLTTGRGLRQRSGKKNLLPLLRRR